MTSGLYILAYSHSTRQGGGGIESKDLEMGKESKRWKNEMMKNIKIFHF